MTNQKSLDKKKTGWRKMTVDDLKRGIDLSKTISGFRVIETKYDKNKPKKLEWVERFRKENEVLEFSKGSWIATGKYVYCEKLENKIKKLLNQQRTELLEEILKVMKDSPYLYIGRFEEYIKSLKQKYA